MKIYAEKNNLKVVLLEPDDWALYQNLALQILEEEQSEIWEEAKMQAENHWRSMLSVESEVRFCVLLENGAPVGDAVIHLGEETLVPTITLDILKTHRNPAVMGLLYDATLKFLVEETGWHFVEIELASNDSGHETALSKGFDYISGISGSAMLLYRRQLDRGPTAPLDLGSGPV